MSSILVLLFPFKDSHSAFEVFCSGSSVFLDAIEVNQWRADVHDKQKDDIIGWRNHRADYTKSQARRLNLTLTRFLLLLSDLAF